LKIYTLRKRIKMAGMDQPAGVLKKQKRTSKEMRKLTIKNSFFILRQIVFSLFNHTQNTKLILSSPHKSLIPQRHIAQNVIPGILVLFQQAVPS